MPSLRPETSRLLNRSRLTGLAIFALVVLAMLFADAKPVSRDRLNMREASGRNEGIYPPVSGNSIGSCDYGKIEKKSRWWLLQAGASVSDRRDNLSQEH